MQFPVFICHNLWYSSTSV